MTRTPMSHWECDGCMVWEDTVGSVRQGLTEIKRMGWKTKGKKHYCPRCVHKASNDCDNCVHFVPSDSTPACETPSHCHYEAKNENKI